MKKTVIALTVLICSLCVTAYANALDSEINDFEIESFASMLETNKENITVEVLYDLNDSPVFLLASITPYGYAIMFREALAISEMSIAEGVTSPYSSLSGKKYYAGPMFYIVMNNGIYTDVISGKTLDRNTILRAGQVTDNALDKLVHSQSAPQVRSIPRDRERIIKNADVIRDMGFGVNVDGTCGQLAAAILLTYYAVVEDKPYVPKSLLDPIHPNNPNIDKRHDGLHQEMIRRCRPFLKGSVPWTVANGINAYIKADKNRRELLVSASWNVLFSNYMAVASIDRDRPCIIFTEPGLFGLQGYGKHAMVAYGYRDIGGHSGYIVHTGWHSQGAGVFIQQSWVIGSTRIESGPTQNLESGKAVALRTFVNAARNKDDNEWTSGSPSIATVDANGRVRAISEGRVIITHRNKVLEQTSEFEFDCFIPVRRIRITKPTREELSQLSIDVGGSYGGTILLNTTITPDDATDKTLVWESSDGSILSVREISNMGQVTAVGFGRARITARDSTGRRRAAITFNVRYNPEGITLNETERTLAVNRTFTPRATLTPTQGIDPNARKNLTWSSSDEKVATVEANGRIKAISEGTATITVTTQNGKTASVVITVTR